MTRNQTKGEFSHHSHAHLSASSLSPSDKARLHQTPSPVARRKLNGDAVTVCKEMSRLDPHYDKHVGPVNPFESMLRYDGR